jgi:Uma2 family endonuclease
MGAAAHLQQSFPFDEILKHGGELVVRGLTKAKFINLSQHYPELRMEREPNGDITIMAPVHGGTGIRENRISFRFSSWRFQNNNGEVFSPSTGFDLPNGATKSPDVSWVSAEKMAKLTPAQIEKAFLPVVPDFVAEVRSGSDKLQKLKEKMLDTWMANGVRLGWLIDPYDEKVYVYKNGVEAEVVSGFDQKIADPEVLPGFELDLSEFKLYGK